MSPYIYLIKKDWKEKVIMDKVGIIEKYKKEDEKLLVSKLFDKIALVEKQNKIQITDFLSPVELEILKDVLKMINFKNYEIYGGPSNSQRNIIIIFPEKLESLFKEKKFDFNSILNCVRIINAGEEYDHKVYLGGLIKLGIKREKIGDIVVYEKGADIVVNKEITKFLISNLNELTRFKKSSIEVIDIKDIIEKEQEFKELKIIVSSLRLDNIVSELAKTSRNKASEILKQERVFINYKNETKPTKLVQEKDLITVRGIGKFIIDEVSGNTRSGKYVLMIKKYV